MPPLPFATYIMKVLERNRDFSKLAFLFLPGEPKLTSKRYGGEVGEAPSVFGSGSSPSRDSEVFRVAEPAITKIHKACRLYMGWDV